MKNLNCRFIILVYLFVGQLMWQMSVAQCSDIFLCSVKIDTFRLNYKNFEGSPDIYAKYLAFDTVKLSNYFSQGAELTRSPIFLLPISMDSIPYFTLDFYVLNDLHFPTDFGLKGNFPSTREVVSLSNEKEIENDCYNVGTVFFCQIEGRYFRANNVPPLFVPVIGMIPMNCPLPVDYKGPSSFTIRVFRSGS